MPDLGERDVRISIHALLAESDNNVLPAYAACGISIHALLAESDKAVTMSALMILYFYPRSPCGERHGSIRPHRLGRGISIHALLAESDMDVSTIFRGL